MQEADEGGRFGDLLRIRKCLFQYAIMRRPRLFVGGPSGFGEPGVDAAVADDMGVSVPTAGYLVSGYALAVVVGALALTPVVNRWQPKRGWRASFAVITVVGLVALAGSTALVPDAPAASARPDLCAELSVFHNTQVWYSLAMTVLVSGGMFGAFMYIEPLLTRVTGFADGVVPWLLLLPAMGFFGFGATPGLQMRVLDHAADAPTLASSANIAAFNVGNFLGVWLSGLAIGAGLGWVSPLWVGAGFAATGLVVLLAATRAERTTPAAEPVAV